MFYATTTKNCLPKKNVCVSAEENGERRTETDASGGEFPNREFPRSGIDGNSSGIPFDLLSRWRALRGFRKTLEDDHD
jgi:hypothetical protein